MYLRIFLKEDYAWIQSNYPLLNKYGIYFHTDIKTTFRRDYFNKYHDYAHVKIKDYFYFHIRDKTIQSFIVKLKEPWRVYSSYIHHKYNDEMLTANLIKFILFNPLSIESIESTDDFLPEEEIVSINNTMKYYSSLPWLYNSSGGNNKIFNFVQIDIPCKNVISISLNRYVSLILEDWVEACSNTKLQNSKWDISLSINFTNLQKCSNISKVIEWMVPNLLSKIAITTKTFSNAKTLFSDLIKLNNNLRSLKYSSSLSISQIETLMKMISKWKDCSITAWDDIDKQEYRHNYL